MARKLHIGFDQGPATLDAQTGKYGILHPRAQFFASGGTTPGTRRYASGHYIAWPTPLSAAGIPNGGTVTGTYPNATVTGALASNAGPAVRSSTNGQTGNLVVAGFVLRHYWYEVEPTAGSYDYTRTDKELAQARALGVPVVFMIVVRTFDGKPDLVPPRAPTNPLPADLKAPIPGSATGYSEIFTSGVSGSSASGVQVWRWSPTIRARYHNICQKLGARYNGDIYFAGIATQETSSGGPTGGSATVYTASSGGVNYTGQDKYTSQGFLDGLDDEDDSISNGCLNAMHFPYQNFMSGPFPTGQNARTMLAQYAAHCQTNGAWFGCPDLVTGVGNPTQGTNIGIVNNVYPQLALYQSGSAPVADPGPTFAAVQNGEWNGTGVGDSPVSLGNLFNYATSSFSCKPANGFAGALDWTSGSPLTCSGIMWDYEIGVGTPNFTTNLVPLMKAFPSFGVFGIVSSFDYYISPTGSNSNNGTSPSTPWAITALNTKRATYTGKTVGLMDGTYSVYAILNDGSHLDQDAYALNVEGGTPSAPTIIKSVNPRGAIITGKSGSNYGNHQGSPMLGHQGETSHRGYVTFDGIKLTGATRNGIRVGRYGLGPQISGITVKNCEFTDFNGTSSDAGQNLSQLELNQCTGHVVQNNYCHDNVGYAANDPDHFTSMLQWASDNGIYEYNTIENSGGVMGKVGGQYGQTFQYNYIDVSALTINAADCIQDFSGYSGSPATTTSLHHNILVGAAGWDFRDVLDNTQYSRDLILVYNNTIVVSGSLTTRGLLVKATAGNGSIYNNIIRDNFNGDHFAVGYNVNIDGVCDYNCYYSSVSALNLAYFPTPATAIPTTVTTIAAFRTATGAEAHSIVTNPSFIGTGSRAAKYVLNGGGCVGTGKTNGSVGGSAVDMGAWGNSPPARIGCDFAQ